MSRNGKILNHRRCRDGVSNSHEKNRKTGYTWKDFLDSLTLKQISINHQQVSKKNLSTCPFLASEKVNWFFSPTLNWTLSKDGIWRKNVKTFSTKSFFLSESKFSTNKITFNNKNNHKTIALKFIAFIL